MSRTLLFIIFLKINFANAQSTFTFSELKANLDKSVPKILEKHAAPGAALAFVQGNEILGVLSYGSADLETQKLISKDTMFNVGSISKLVTTWGVMQLVEQG